MHISKKSRTFALGNKTNKTMKTEKENINCAVIIDEHTSFPYCVIKSKNIVSDETLKGYAKQWITEHSDCSWSEYRYVIMDIKDAPKIKKTILL